MVVETRPSRSRTGCLTCRKRHLKCNEQRPKCSRCVASNRPCQYPFIDSIVPDLDHDQYVFPEGQRWLQPPRTVRFISEVFIPPDDEPEKKIEPRPHHRRRRKSSMRSVRSDSAHYSGSLPSPTSTSSDRDEGDMASPGPEISLFPDLDFNAKSPDEKGHIRSVYAPGPYKPIEDPYVSQLLQYYMHNVAPWLDLTDPLCHFARRVPHMAIRCPMLQNAVLALSSSRMIRVESAEMHTELGLETLTADRYYGACMGYLIPALEVPDVVADEAIPVTTVLLHTYEIFEGHVDSQKHLKGTMSVFAHQRHLLRRPGIRRTTFWTYIRQEIIVALQTKRPTNIDWELWQGDMYWGDDCDDAWANRMSWIMVKVLNFYFGEYDSKKATEEAAKFLQYEVNNWKEHAPLTLGAVSTLVAGVCDEEPFPVISYSCLWHFIGMQFYHLACILLGLRCAQSSATTDDVLSHAHQVVGAAVTLGRRSPGAMINSIGPLIVCGQVVSKPSERMRLLNLLTEIGAVTGWPVGKETGGLLRDWSIG